MCDTKEFWICGFIDHLRIVTTSNYKSELYTPNITVTTAPIKSAVFTRRFLATDFNTVRLRPYRLVQITKLQELISSTAQLLGWRPSRINLLVFSSLTD
jgi:hypothetical protein